MTVSTKPMTADELLRLADDGKRYELIKGALFETSPAGTGHGMVAMRAGAILYRFVCLRRLGEVFAADTGFVISSDPDTVRAPDVAFVAAGRIPSSGVPAGYMRLAPDLVVEVVSPSDTASDLESKVFAWLDAGCRLVWVVYPAARSVTIFRSRHDVRALSEEDTLDGSPVFDAFNLEVRELFG
ncbi:MAG: Uma2 family endonuclease [Candidatus Tectomicrobia bacterium]|nr:Uma2 family endonuclease [Candidatus Tectomicrobia bacterium]